MLSAIKNLLRRGLSDPLVRRRVEATRKGAYVAAALALASCTTFDAAKFAEAANALDPDCYKRTEITVTPLLVFGWPVPIVAAKHVKECAGKQSAPVSSDLSSINLGSLVQ